MSSSFRTTHQIINGLISRFHLGVFTPSYDFQHVLWQDIWDPLCSNLIMFWPQGKCLVYNLTNLPNLSIIFPILLHNAPNVIWITTSLNACAHIPSMLQCPPLKLCPQQWAHGHPWCNSRHFYYHCTRRQLPCGTKTSTRASFNHIPFFLSTS